MQQKVGYIMLKQGDGKKSIPGGVDAVIQPGSLSKLCVHVFLNTGSTNYDVTWHHLFINYNINRLRLLINSVYELLIIKICRGVRDLYSLPLLQFPNVQEKHLCREREHYIKLFFPSLERMWCGMLKLSRIVSIPDVPK